MASFGQKNYALLFFLHSRGYQNKRTAHECWTLDFFVSDIKLQAIYKVIHTSNYDGHISITLDIQITGSPALL